MSDQTANSWKAHVAIRVKSLHESIRFYRRLWGVEPSKVRTGYAKFDVINPPLNFTMNEEAAGISGGVSHFGIQVSSTEEVLAVRQRWMSEGLAVRDEMKTACCYALQDKTWVQDPDGYQWEVFVVLQDDLPGRDASKEPCCVPQASLAVPATGA